MNNLRRLRYSQTNRDLLSKQNRSLVIRKMFSATGLIRLCGHDKAQVQRSISVCIAESEVFVGHRTNLLLWFWGEHKCHSKRKTKTQPTQGRQILCSATALDPFFVRKLPFDQLSSSRSIWWSIYVADVIIGEWQLSCVASEDFIES